MSRRPAAVLAVMALGLALSCTAAAGQSPRPGTTLRIDGSRTFQRIDGFGFSEAFQRSNVMHGSLGLSAARQQQVVDLLFDRTRGAGFSILRNGIGASPSNALDHMRSIEPVSPGRPDAAPATVFDGSDDSQVWLSQQAAAHGVTTIYADAWSAPGYMKTNGDDANGGSLCGTPDAPACATGDWRQAYADYLASYVQLYQQAGVHITHLGFLNEPELTTAYSSMLESGTQAADFIKILDRTLRSHGLDTKVVCCDAEGWEHGASMIGDILQDPAAAQGLAVASSHGYSGAPSAPLTTASIPVWETEWADFNPWNPVWDDGSEAAGLTWADHVLTALTTANASAFLYWWGASQSTANSGLIQLVGDSVNVSARFWALAAFSRFIRPGAVRVATDGAAGLESAAFRNGDGSVVIELLNSTTASQSLDVSLRGLGRLASAQLYLTGTGHDLAPRASVASAGGGFSASVPARSLVTAVVQRQHS